MRGRHTLGQRVRRLRNSAGLSQDALARAAGVGRVTLVRLEKGEQTPRFKTLRQLSGLWGYAYWTYWSNRSFFANDWCKGVQHFTGMAQRIALAGSELGPEN